MLQTRTWKISRLGADSSSRVARRRLFAALALTGTLNLQGCASSTETFALGAVLGSIAGATAVTCTVLCN